MSWPDHEPLPRCPSCRALLVSADGTRAINLHEEPRDCGEGVSVSVLFCSKCRHVFGVNQQLGWLAWIGPRPTPAVAN